MGSEVLQMRLHESGDTKTLSLRGDLDSFTSPRLTDIADSLVDNTAHLVIDLNDLQYIDSAGLSALILTWVEARNKGIKFTMYCENHRVKRVFEITGLQELFIFEQAPTTQVVVPLERYSASQLAAIRRPGIQDLSSPG
jgi:anti-sigma B factor antagonist